MAVLGPKGRLAVVAFHSLEDRIVKLFFAGHSAHGARASRHAPAADRSPVGARFLRRRPVAAVRIRGRGQPTRKIGPACASSAKAFYGGIGSFAVIKVLNFFCVALAGLLDPRALSHL